MRVAIAQVNPTLGDFLGNSKKILEYANKAHQKKADLVVFPECALFGYHPFDLLERDHLVDLQLRQLSEINKKIPLGITVVVGVITRNPAKRGRPFFNSAAVLCRNKKTEFFHKVLLPTGDVFDEARFIEAGDASLQRVFSVKGKRVGITICEDIWAWDLPKQRNPYLSNPLKNIKKWKVDLVLNLSASPFYPGKFSNRHLLARKTAAAACAPFVYANLVGGQDEIIFDGQSFGVDKKGKIFTRSTAFLEDLNIFDLEEKRGGLRPQKLESREELRQALVLGIRDFIKKQGFNSVHFGLSGGIDSAVVACLCVDALGPSRVTAVAIPGPYSSTQSLQLAQQLAKNLGIRLIEVGLDKSYKALRSTVDKAFGFSDFTLAHENLQARLRGVILMALANKENSLLIGTSNKSELATGYSTLYGDLCGALLPIGDLTKRRVYDLAQLYNSEIETIPTTIILREPSAELRPNQRDSDSLPKYEILDKAVEQIVEDVDDSRNQIMSWVEKRILSTEFKRWQSPPILKVSKRAFGRGRRYPICKKI
jgi:NAD+ synthase (glutamine-hydrolysing)